MDKIKDIETALLVIQDAADKQAIAIDNADSKQANKHYDKIVKAMTFLKDKNAMEHLVPLLKHHSIGVRLWVASYLLPQNEAESLKVLEEIAKLKGAQGFSASITIEEWKKGNLKPYFK